MHYNILSLGNKFVSLYQITSVPLRTIAKMKQQNLFDGDSFYAAFTQTTYKLLISRKWVTYAEVMAESQSKDLDCNISNCDNYGQLKKAFPAVCKAIKEREGEGSIVSEGNKRDKRFRYIGKDNDPLSDMRNARVINNLRQYWKFCQDSAGFFPESWLEYYFKDCQDLLDIKAKRQKGEQVISTSLDRILTNIEYLPMLHEAIVNKIALEIDYKPFYEEMKTLTFHPHYLKEYNGRWHLLGHAEGEEPEYGYNIALDRIQARPRERAKITYIGAPKMFYEQYFYDIVGLTHKKDVPTEKIVVRAHTLYIYKLTETKRIHHSQEVVTPFGEYNDGSYGEFSIQVKINDEFIGRILQMGPGLEIISPENVREAFKERVDKMAELYKNHPMK